MTAYFRSQGENLKKYAVDVTLRASSGTFALGSMLFCDIVLCALRARGFYFSLSLNGDNAGKLDPVIGRDEEIRRTLQVLSRRTKNNPVFVS